MSNRGKRGILVAIAVALLIIDQLIKISVKLNMTLGEAHPMFGGSSWAYILFIENNGMAFGMQLGGIVGKLLLSIFRLILIAFIIWYINYIMVKRKAGWGVLICFVLILVGAIGNMIDCTLYGMIFSESTTHSVASVVPFGTGYASLLCGKVVDMFYFPLIRASLPSWLPIIGGREFEFFRPVFNFADSCITIGVLALIIFHWRFFATKKEKASPHKE